MERQGLFLTLTVMFLGLLYGCATTTFQSREPTYTEPLEKGTVLRQFSLEPGINFFERVTDRNRRGCPNTQPLKERLDKLLVSRGLVKGRELARALIIEGKVFVEGNKITKAGTLISDSAEISLREEVMP